MHKKNNIIITINIKIDEPLVDFKDARKSADDIANKKLIEPLLIAWYDGIAEKGHPDVHECTNKPGWQTYAESRGGQLAINVNEGKYVFIYTETSLNDI